MKLHALTAPIMHDKAMTIHNENKKINNQIDWIAYYQIAGGLLGIALMLDMTFRQLNEFSIKSLFFLIPFIFFLYSIYCGYTLLKRFEYSYNLTKLNQYLQIPQISIVGLSYQYYAGVFLGVGLSGIVNVGFNFSLADFKFIFNNSNDEFILMANLIPIIIIKRLSKLTDNLESNKEMINMIEKNK